MPTAQGTFIPEDMTLLGSNSQGRALQALGLPVGLRPPKRRPEKKWLLQPDSQPAVLDSGSHSLAQLGHCGGWGEVSG